MAETADLIVGADLRDDTERETKTEMQSCQAEVDGNGAYSRKFEVHDAAIRDGKATKSSSEPSWTATAQVKARKNLLRKRMPQIRCVASWNRRILAVVSAAKTMMQKRSYNVEEKRGTGVGLCMTRGCTAPGAAERTT